MTTDTPDPVPVASDATNGERKAGLIQRGSKLGLTGFKASRGCCSGFCDFLLSGNVVQLAVAFVIAQATVSLVNALVRDIITPLISAIFGGTDFSNLYFTVHHSRFMYGDLANYALSFLVICLIVYFLIVLPMTAALRRMFPKPDERECPECLSKIDARAIRCMFCTVAVPPVEVVVDGKKALDAETGTVIDTNVRRRGCCCGRASATV